MKLKLALKPNVIIIIIDNRGLNARWCLTPFLLSLPTAAYLGQRGLTPGGLSHTTAQCHLTILGEAVLFCLNHPSFRTPGSLSFCCRSFRRCSERFFAGDHPTFRTYSLLRLQVGAYSNNLASWMKLKFFKNYRPWLTTTSCKQTVRDST